MSGRLCRSIDNPFAQYIHTSASASSASSYTHTRTPFKHMLYNPISHSTSCKRPLRLATRTRPSLIHPNILTIGHIQTLPRRSRWMPPCTFIYLVQSTRTTSRQEAGPPDGLPICVQSVTRSHIGMGEEEEEIATKSFFFWILGLGAEALFYPTGCWHSSLEPTTNQTLARHWASPGFIFRHEA